MAAAKYRIGFSQATILETWRVQFNKDMKREAEKHPEIELIIADGQNKTEKQVADVENFISQGVDVLIVSPKESAGLTPVVEKAIDAGIPVIILDRNVNTDRITQFIGGDNVVIGQAAGEYAVKLLGGPGNAKGNVVEIWGGFASAPAHDRSTGFHAVTDKEPGIKYLLAPIDTEWKAAKGYEIMATALQANENIDLVYAHNDPLAYNAYLASKDAGREKGIKFMGIDGIPDEGVTWVEKGDLDATFLYATPGRGRHPAGAEAAERREDREEDHPADDDDHQGQRSRDHQGQRLITGPAPLQRRRPTRRESPRRP